MAQTTEEILNKLKADILAKSDNGSEYSKVWIVDVLKMIDQYLPKEEESDVNIIQGDDGVIHIDSPIS